MTVDLNSWRVPADLSHLTLYAQDEKLCQRWPELMAAWRIAFPRLNITAEVAKAHAWELSNPKNQKKIRSRFLQSWLSRVHERRSVAGQLSHQQGKPEAAEVCAFCKGSKMIPTTEKVPVRRWGKTVMEDRQIVVRCTNC